MPAHPDARLEALLRHHDWVRALAHSLLADAASADDLAQEAWLAALRAPPRDAEAGRAWFRRVVLNRLRNRARESSRRDRRERVAARPEALADSTELVGRAEALREVTDAVLALPEPFRGCILQHYFDGLSPTEIAEREGVPAATIRSRLTRGRARLRAVLAERSDDDGRSWLTAVLLLPGSTGTSAHTSGSSARAPRGPVRAWLIGSVLLGVAAALVVVVLWTTREPPTRAPATLPETATNGADTRERTSRASVAAPELRDDRSAEEPASVPVAPTDPAEQHQVVAGLVTDGAGEPVHDALVRVRVTLSNARPATVETRTGADGRFRLEGVGGDLLRRADGVDVLADGLASLHVPAATLDTEGLPERLVLVPETILTGRVVDADGQPVGGATLHVLGRPETAFSDAEGAFELGRLPPGAHSLVVRSDRHVTLRTELPRVEAGAFQVGRLELAPGAVLRGRVLAPLGLAHVELREPGTGFVLARTLTNGRGQFLFRNHPRTPVDLHVTEAIDAPDAEIGRVVVRHDVQAGDALEIAFDDRNSLRLWLSDSDTRLPLELHDVELTIRRPDGEVVLTRRWDQGLHSGVRVPLEPGTYRVEVEALGRGRGVLEEVVVPPDQGATYLVPMPPPSGR